MSNAKWVNAGKFESAQTSSILFLLQISKKLCKLNVLTLKCDFGVLHTLTKYITSFNYEML